MFDSSLKHDGQFSKNVIGAVATGSISAVGSITGSRAAQALTSYLGYESQNSGDSIENGVSVEGGDPVTSERGQTSDAGIPVTGQTPPGRGTSVPMSGTGAPTSVQSPAQVSDSSPVTGGAPVSTSDAGSVADEPPSEFPGVSNSASEDIITPDGGAIPYPGSPTSDGSVSPGQQADSPMTGTTGGMSVPGQPTITPMPVASETSEASDEPPTEFPGVPYSGSTPPEDTVTLNGGSAGTCDAPSSQAESTAQDQQPIVSGARTAPGGQAASIVEGQNGSIPQAPPTFRNVEIGGGRITGYETPAGGGEERQFAMYNASQYMEPSGPHETVKTTDGESWYKQYAQPTVQKTPKEVSPGKIRYDEKIVQTMPQIPKRKDRV